jgi:hypothetical protein
MVACLVTGGPDHVGRRPHRGGVLLFEDHVAAVLLTGMMLLQEHEQPIAAEPVGAQQIDPGELILVSDGAGHGGFSLLAAVPLPGEGQFPVYQS